MSEVCPLEWRYGSKEMRKVFNRQNIINTFIKVEKALLLSLHKLGYIKQLDEKKLDEIKITANEVEELEKKIGHDVMALAILIAEKLGGEVGNFVHFGATSYDIVDTSYALLFKDALNIIKSKLIKIISILILLSEKYENSIMPGRTHGQHALPITLGFKFANYVYELTRSYERILDLEKRLIRLKFSGAVGTMAAYRGKGLEVEKVMSEILGLEPHPISTQVAPRDSFAELICTLAILASQLDRLSLEVRELMRPEIGELAEGVEGRVGSSTMPQKENPVTAEKISGLAKVIRGLVITSLENIPLWHERDLTNSSSERIVIPHAFLIIDEMLDSTILLLNGLRVNEERMKKNLEVTKGLIVAESLMIALTQKGMPRHKAHELVRELSRNVIQNDKSLLEVAINDKRVREYLKEEEIREYLDPTKYLGSYRELIQRSLEYAKRIINLEAFS
ncbi:MAG: adenylosuccinate lyase [Sulfolobaceae archaeon]